ncbi:MAG TPA: helix-turn-helix domain-containing protein [archaeon]|nr:helix-turn-helix domain-containing protein [archaeon]
MKNFLDVLSQEILPGARAMIAKKLIENGLSQKQAAAKMGVSQPAISQYKRDLRGSKSEVFKGDPKLTNAVNHIATRLATGDITMHTATLELWTACKEFLESHADTK